ncbi:Fic family protein [Streptococcus sp. NLN64]|uniref:Fic/DOC family protein n=1 Tax=Streptococcus sp. NLN64 TaxID=2822799 RepID=UPI0018CAFBF1|nr:Fic family protein [Streptococcus sp. NLN64]MBG9366687.1 Fic family protein [Streptococcus sp. NLN64]
MARKIYEEYSYIDLDNYYVYPNSSVLRNKFHEQDKAKAQELEFRLVASKTIKLFGNPIEVHSVSDILAIHQFLFGEMYEWAGQYRCVNISKSGKAFLPIQSFDMAEKFLNRLITNYLNNSGSREVICRNLVEILDNLNYFHPFREGNGRTQREVIRSLALMKGYECEISIGVDDDVYNLYMDGTVYSDKKKLEKLFDKLVLKL